MKILKLTSLAALAIGLAVFSTTSAQAQVIITWGAATNVTGGSDIYTAGSLVSAVSFNPGNSGPKTESVSGVTFQTATVVSNNFKDASNLANWAMLGTAGQFTGGGLGTGGTYLNIVGGGHYNSGVTTGFTDTLTLSGLTNGHNYELQIWSGGFDNRLIATFGSDSSFANPTVTLNPASNGQFALGTFTAGAATSEVVYFKVTNPSSANHYLTLGAVELRDITIPEPATWGLLAFSLTAVMVLRRRRRS